MTSAKKTVEMSEEEVWNFIHERKKDKIKWETIVSDLKKTGYVSPLTGKPLTISAVRYTYYYSANGKRRRPIIATELKSIGGAPNEHPTLHKLRQILALNNFEDEEKLKMIREIVK